MDPLNALLLMFSIVSTILYVYILAIIHRNRTTAPFDSHFFCVFKSIGAIDILSIIHLYIFGLFRYWGWINYSSLFEHYLIRSWDYIGATYMYLNQAFGMLIMAINRFLNITRPEIELWDERVCRVAVAVQWVSSVVFTAPWYTQEYVITEIVVGANTTDQYSYLTLMAGDPDFEANYSSLLYVLVMVVSIATAVLYAKLYWHARQLKKENILSSNDRVNIRLAAMGLILFVLMVISIHINVVVMIIQVSSSTRELLISLYYVVQVLFSVINPWLLLVCSSATRTKAREALSCASNIVHPLYNNTAHVHVVEC